MRKTMEMILMIVPVILALGLAAFFVWRYRKPKNLNAEVFSKRMAGITE